MKLSTVIVVAILIGLSILLANTIDGALASGEPISKPPAVSEKPGPGS